MVILDSNVFIYLANGTLDRLIIRTRDIANASITKIEAMGYPRILAAELIELETLFSESYNLPLTDEIIERAIKLRQAKRLSLGDAIIAATAIETGCGLWTANEKDFAGIEDIKIYNPLKS